MPYTLRSVAAAALRREAARVEAYAVDQLPSWIVLRQIDAYDYNVRDARELRHAADIKSLAARREYLRAAGWRFDRAL